MQHLIDRYQLTPHPEGGYFREVYRAPLNVDSPLAEAPRSALTHIYFLLTRGQVSRFHRVIHDEIWNVYEGAPLRLVTFDGVSVDQHQIGSGCDDYVHVVAGGLFQAAESTGDYTLVGCSVAPGFDFSDFSFLSDQDEPQRQLRTNHPELRRFV